MFTCHRQTLQTIAFFLLLAAPAFGGTANVPLQEFLGTYEFNSFATPVPGCNRSVTVQTTYAFGDVTTAHLVIEGSSTPAIVRGDGVLLPDQVIDTETRFILGFVMGSAGYLGTYDLATGAFAFDIEYESPFNQDLTEGMPVPDYFSPTIQTCLSVWNPLWIPPGTLEPPPEGAAHWYDGLVIVQPATAMITNAYLVIEGPGVPEPATLSLLTLGSLALLKRRKS